MMSEVKICPSCTTSNERNNVFCMVCHQPLTLVEVVDTNGVLNNAQPESQTASKGNPSVCVCGEELKAGDSRCVYCDRPVPGAEDSSCFVLKWSWGESLLTGNVFVGRVPPVVSDLAQRIEQSFPNISRLHAEFCSSPDGFHIKDYASMNGTFVNGRRIEPHVPVVVSPGDVIRFASRLEVTIGLSTTRGRR